MTVLTVQQITGTAMLPLAPSSSGPAAPGLGHRIDTQWARADIRAKMQAERKAALRKAAAAVETRATTKAERLAKTERNRETGSEAERRQTRGMVAKALEKVAAAHPDVNLTAADTREALAKLKHYYPGKSAGEIVAEAAKWDAAMRDDPVAGREAMLEHYSKLSPEHFKPYEPVKQAAGLRGSLQRARQDQEDAQSLAAAQKRYGAALPHILAQLERWDSSLRADPVAASARLAVSQGAPVTERQVPAYLAARAEKAHAAHVAKRHAEILKGIDLAIHHGVIPGDEEHLANVAAVLAHQDFKHHPTDGLATLRAASAVAAQLPRRSANRSDDAGTKSISGGPGPGQGGRASRSAAGAGSTRDSIRRVREAG